MLEAALAAKAKNEEINKMRAAMPKGLKSKQTVTSLLRKEANRQVFADQGMSRSPSSMTNSKTSKRNQSMNLSKPAMQVLPPIQRAPGSRRGFSRGMLVNNKDQHSSSVANMLSQVGSNPSVQGGPSKNPQAERVLFPTHVKESFLQRNAHMANAKMSQMASEFALKAMGR